MLFAHRTRILGGIALVALAACNNPNGIVSTPAGSTAGGPAVRAAVKPQSFTTRYIQVVMFENKTYDEVIGSPKAPYITGLSQQWANMTQSFAIRHPSEPNYVALFSGSTEGLASDWCPRTYYGVSLGSELLEAGISFLGYAESMPENGFEGCQATPEKHAGGFLYRRKHNAWADFVKVPRKDSIVYRAPLTKAPAQVVFISPNMCSDMHDCGVSIGDKWASKNLPKLIAWDQANNGVLILTFDENDGSPGNQIPTILAGNVNPGQYSQTINHYNVLRTIEDVFEVKPINNAKSADDIQGVIK
jgi:phosphatidylinositol-3-phosphatase